MEHYVVGPGVLRVRLAAEVQSVEVTSGIGSTYIFASVTHAIIIVIANIALAGTPNLPKTVNVVHALDAGGEYLS